MPSIMQLAETHQAMTGMEVIIFALFLSVFVALYGSLYFFRDRITQWACIDPETRRAMHEGRSFKLNVCQP